MTEVALPEIREMLFADLHADQAAGRFAEGVAAGDPGSTALLAIATAAMRGDAAAARSALAELTGDAAAETRSRLLGWSMARAAGLTPPEDEARAVLGVVVDVGLDAGVDTVAAYVDGSARYLNQAGGGVFWDARPDAGIRAAIDVLLMAGQAVADRTGSLDGPRPAAPGEGGAAIWLLTPGGIHAGIGPFQALFEDGLGGPVLRAAMELMRLLIERSQADPA